MTATRRARLPAPLVALVAASLVAACGPATQSPSASVTPSGSPSPSPAAGQPVLVDTDVAPDDVMALAYLVARPEVDLVAVTVSGTGEARCPDGVRVVRSVLERLGRADVPVACGRDTPLVGDHEFPAPWRDSVADGFRLDLPEPTGGSTDLDAPALITQAAADADGALTVLTLGPLTNVADALSADPTLAERIADVTIMAGAVLTAGNVGDPDGDGSSVNAEWNAYIDPRALAVVIASGAPVTLVALDATDDVPMTPTLALRIAANRSTESARLVHELLIRNPERTAGTSLWDQTAALLLADGPDGLTLERLPVTVIETEGRESGRTAVAPDGIEILVTTAADPTVVTGRFIEGLNGGIAEAPIPAPVATVTAAFDGDTCRVDAPSEFPAGFVELVLENDAAGDAAAFIVRFSGEGSWESLLEVIAAGPITTEPEGVTVALAADASPAEATDGLAALDAGAYGVACGLFDDAGLIVTAGIPLTITP